MVEHFLGKEEAVGPIPILGSILRRKSEACLRNVVNSINNFYGTSELCSEGQHLVACLVGGPVATKALPLRYQVDSSGGVADRQKHFFKTPARNDPDRRRAPLC